MNLIEQLLSRHDAPDKSLKLSLPEDPEARNRLILGGVGFLLFFYAYFLRHTCLIGVTGSPPTSLMGWLWREWSRGADYAHGYVVPFAAVGVAIWKWKKTLHAVPLSSSNFGLAVIVLALTLYWVGAKSTNPRVLAISMIVLIFGAIWYLAGWEWAKGLWFATAFLLFMIPLTFLEPIIAFPLRQLVTSIAVSALNLFGMDVYQVGTAIKSTHDYFEPLDVADPCSGIRSLVALMALTSLYGYTVMDKPWKKWVLFLSSMPLAVIGNLARITTIAFVAQGFGEEWAMPLYHDYSGYIVFSLAILCMIGLGAALNFHYRDLIHHWVREEVPLPQRPVRKRVHRRHGSI